MALTPLVVAVCRAPARPVSPDRRDFLLGLTAGVVYFGGTVYWTGGVMARYGGLSWPVAAAVAALLVGYLSLFPGLFTLTLARVRKDLGPGAAVAVVPFLWVASEYGRLAILDGFPWVLLGYSQVTVLPVAQLAAVTGVFGVSWLLAATSTAAAWAVIGAPRTRWRPAIVAALVLVSVAGWGAVRVSDARLAAAGRPLEVGVVQANVAQEEKWDPSRSGQIYRRYLELTRKVIGEGAALVLWPESATPFSFARAVEAEELRRLARDTGSAVLLGSDLWERGNPARVYNAAFLVDPQGMTAGVYRKVQLVPFGEYVPLQPLLFFAAPLVQGVSDFKAGTEVNALPLDGGLISVAICYEVVYPGLIREGVLNGSQLLTTITNDAWFGRSSAASQHFEMASMRAIEQGRYLVRAANTGISGVVDPYGRVLERTDLFVEGTFVRGVRLLDEVTPYARVGDLIVWLSLACSAAVLLARYRR